MTLHSRSAVPGTFVIRGARVLDPVEGVDSTLDVIVEKGVIAELAQPGGKAGGKAVEAKGLVLAPAFVDPHVHVRSPGREDEETIASGSAAAAAGGYCAILAMPNTAPVVDCAAVLGALVELAQEEALIPTGFMAAISRGLAGEELTDMGELAAAGAAAFTDDGKPIRSAGLMRRALQYAGSTGRRLALHCEEPTLSHNGQMHEGIVSAELGLGGYPSVAESVAVARDLALAAYEQQSIHLMHLSTRESVELLRRALADGVEASAEATPHHLCLTDEAVRSLDANLKMNPPLRPEEDRRALIEALKDGVISCIATDHAPHARQEKDVPFEAAPFGVTGLETSFAALYTNLVEPGLISLETLLERMSAGPARAFELPVPRIAAGEPANLVLLDLESSWTVQEERFRSLSVNSWLLGQTLKGEVVLTVAGGRVAFGSERIGA
jgi:dihydroorotase